MTNQEILNQNQYQKLQREISELLTATKQQIEKLANSALADCYWQIGKKIDEENLSENASYKNLLLQNLEEDLKISKKTLNRALQLYQSYPNGIEEGLSWSHYRHLITVTDPDARQNLSEQARGQKWSVRQLETTIKTIDEKENRNKFKSRTSTPVGVRSQKNSSKTIKSQIKRPKDPSYLYKAKIVNVVDGDTLILNIDLGFQVIKEQRVRIAQINAPEIKTPAGKKSHHYLRDLCASIGEVAAKTNKIDIYGRYLVDIFYLRGESKRGTTQADIFTKGVYLNAKIVEDGMATSF